MTALVSSSASAQATETDLGGLKVRSKPATGTAPAGAFGTPLTGFRSRVGHGGEHVGHVLFGDLGVGLYAPPVVQGQSPEPTNTPGGVPEEA